MTKRKQKANRSNTQEVQPRREKLSKGQWLLGTVIATVTAVGALSMVPDSEAVDMVVYKDPNCGCCGKWIDHMENAGYDVAVRNRRDMKPIKAEQGVPKGMRSCHTAVVDGYFVEGHVPAEDVTYLLAHKHGVKGLAVPGMPLGSPGMEVPGEEPMRYTVYAVGHDGKQSAFARH